MNIEFLEIKPNNNKDIIDFIMENISNRLAKSINIDETLLFDIELETNNIVYLHKNHNPVNFINNYFKNDNFTLITTTNNNDDNIYYDIIAYDYYNDKVNIILINKLLNSSNYIKDLTEKDLDLSLNLLASLLSKFNNNNTVLLGSVFILTIDKKFYEQLYDVKSYKSLYDLYYSFNLYNLVKSIINVYFIKIYAKPKNNVFYYTRDILDNCIKTYKCEIKDKYIKCFYKDLILYIKYVDPLIDSYYSIMKNVNDNCYYLVSLNNIDIKIIEDL